MNKIKTNYRLNDKNVSIISIKELLEKKIIFCKNMFFRQLFLNFYTKNSGIETLINNPIKDCELQLI